jgi:thiol-disulfide isomerase/thioredoxin
VKAFRSQLDITTNPSRKDSEAQTILLIMSDLNETQNSKFTAMRLLLLASVSSLLVTTEAFQVTQPVHTRGPKVSPLFYTVTEDVPDAVQTVEFEKNIRELYKSHKQLEKETLRKEKTTPPNMRSIDTFDDLRKAVAEEADGKMTVVRFHAPYCQSCKQMQPLLYNFARRNPDINFIEVAYTQDQSNREIVDRLGVPSFPYCHVYHPTAGFVEESSVNKKYFKDVVKIIESYQDGGCDLPPDADDDTGLFDSPYKSVEETRISW